MVSASNSKAMVLIGGFGFVGQNILHLLSQDDSAADFRPIVIDNLSNACPGYEKFGVAALEADYTSDAVSDFLAKQDDGPRTFVFLAGETRVAESKDRPMDFIDANIVEPSRFVLDHVREGDTFILISTAGALFDGSFEIRTDSAYCPKNFYGASKAAEEMVLEKLVELRGGRFAVVRMTNVYGIFSDKKKSAIHAFTRAAISGDTVTVNGDGLQTRDFIYSGDVARGIVSVAKAAHGDGTFRPINLLGSGESISLNDVIAGIEAASGAPLACNRIPAKELIATEPRDVIVARADVEQLLGPTITSLQDGLRETHAYYSAR